MLGKLSLNSVSSRVRALFGKHSGASSGVAGRQTDDFIAIAPRMESGAGFDSHKVETVNGESVSIFVAKPAEATYFEEDGEYAPTVVSVGNRVAVQDTPAGTARKERISVAEPADLFINALRRPPRQKFDASVPRIKTKAVVEETAAAPAVGEHVATEAVSVPEATVVEDVAEIPAADTPAEAVSFGEIAGPVAIEEIPAEETVAASVIEEIAEPVGAETVPVTEDLAEVLSVKEVIEAAPAGEIVFVPVTEEVPEAASVEEAVESIPAEETVAAPVETETESLEIPVVADSAETVTVPEAAEEVPEVIVESIEIPAETVEATVIAAPVGDEAEVNTVAVSEAAEPVQAETIDFGTEVEATPVLALPVPTQVIPALPRKIEVPALGPVSEEGSREIFAGNCLGDNEVLTSESEAIVTNTETHVSTIERELPYIISNLERDILFAFRSELKDDEADFFATTMDDNRAFREDYLDETETTFKIRASGRFKGNLRTSAFGGNFSAPAFDGNFRNQGFSGNLRSLYY